MRCSAMRGKNGAAAFPVLDIVPWRSGLRESGSLENLFSTEPLSRNSIWGCWFQWGDWEDDAAWRPADRTYVPPFAITRQRCPGYRPRMPHRPHKGNQSWTG